VRAAHRVLARIVAPRPLIRIGASTKLGGDQPIHYSGDGGKTWSQSNLPSVTGDVRQGDPAIDWTSDGTAWSLTLGISANLVGRCFKSTGGGATWTFDSTFSGTQTSVDKESLWIDHSPTSPHRDNMYAIWHTSAPCFVATRNGPGGTWSAPIQVSGSETTGSADGGDIKTNTFGDAFAFWPDTGGNNLFVAKSTDGGASFGTPVQIASTIGAFQIGVPAQDERLVLIYISGGAYRDATNNLSMPPGPIWPAAPAATPQGTSRAPTPPPPARAGSGSPDLPTAAPHGRRPGRLTTKLP
jgi:hypothetical protein